MRASTSKSKKGRNINYETRPQFVVSITNFMCLKEHRSIFGKTQFINGFMILLT